MNPMALDRGAQAALALHRFGLGPREGSIAAIASDPRGALLAELDRPDAGRIEGQNLRSGGEVARAVHQYAIEQRARAEKQPASPETGPASALPNPSLNVPQQIYLAEVKARYDAATSAEIGFVERLVWFWSNHFCISAEKGEVRPLCGAYEREAIRSHVLGTFSGMLLAAEQHPAMMRYLDNTRSIGPDSRDGLRQKRGLNENLAREILELHTLGVRSGYTQDDVMGLAEALTGWTTIPFANASEKGGEFRFNPHSHQPGARTIVGKTYGAAGVEQGRAVLADLARHPATAKHIATKLAHHFVADDPPQALVEKLSRRFAETEGNLKQLAVALVDAPESWSAPRERLKRPGEWIVGAMRVSGFAPPDVRRIMQMQIMLGEPLWWPPAPKGFPDGSAAWLEGIVQRIDIANEIARRVGETHRDAAGMVDTALGPLASAETSQTVRRAESRTQALALLLMAPEFQRR
jgi:uncharacterized protein (DUF1800 family)